MVVIAQQSVTEARQRHDYSVDEYPQAANTPPQPKSIAINDLSAGRVVRLRMIRKLVKLLLTSQVSES
jgi:hypothetical protein